MRKASGWPGAFCVFGGRGNLKQNRIKLKKRKNSGLILVWNTFWNTAFKSLRSGLRAEWKGYRCYQELTGASQLR